LPQAREREREREGGYYGEKKNNFYLNTVNPVNTINPGILFFILCKGEKQL
jgi:hypothetical protein